MHRCSTPCGDYVANKEAPIGSRARRLEADDDGAAILAERMEAHAEPAARDVALFTERGDGAGDGGSGDGERAATGAGDGHADQVAIGRQHGAAFAAAGKPEAERDARVDVAAAHAAPGGADFGDRGEA